MFQVTQDGLTAFRKATGAAGNALVPDLATTLPRSADGGRTWTLELRSGVRYANGASVRPSDVRFTFERLFKVHAAVAAHALRRRRGRRRLPRRTRRPARSSAASRSRGARITFNLVKPDPNWLQKLALPPAALLPPSVGDEEIGTDVSRLTGTGPYYWSSYSPARQLVLRRNPFFKAWAPAAQPDGNVDTIVERFGLGIEAEVTQVERGQADWVVDERAGRPPRGARGPVRGRSSTSTACRPTGTSR